MNPIPKLGAVSYTRQILFWSRGKIPHSAYTQIRKHQRDKEELLEIAMLEEWIVDN